MLRYFLSLRIAALVIVAGIVVAAIDTAWRGFAVVHDPDALASRITLVDPQGEREMREFAAGYFAARPRAVGEISVRCRSGRVIDGGDVEPGARTTFTVTRAQCRP